MKSWSFLNKFVLIAGLLLASQGFAANCAADYVPPENPVWDGSTKTEPCTKDGFYIIDNAAKLAWYAAYGSDNNGNFTRGNAKLTADIDLGGKLWTPIAAGKGGGTEYTKIFDGNGHVIYDLYIKASELAQIKGEYAQNLGFVGVLGGGTIKNLILENVNIQAATNAGSVNGLTTDNQISVGAVVGWMSEKGSSRVDTCMASGTIKTTGNGQGVGGIVGNAKKGTISNCLSLVEIHTSGSDSYVGGVIGITKTDVTVSSCVYAGPGLTNTGAEGLTGGIAGNVFTGKLTTNNNYFEGTGINGVGGTICKSKKNECTQQNATSAANSIANADAQNVNETNADNVACALNGTNGDGSCKEEPWSVGQTGLSLNGYGADGYKITFKAKSGSFSDGTVSKNIFLQKGMIISAAEIGEPTHADSAFAGWSLDSNATDPVADLGSVSKATKVYAVWYPIYTITFSAAPGVFTDGDTTKTIQLAKNERITVENIELPFSYTNNDSVKFYFTGWALMENAPEEDTLSVLPNATSDTTLHAVWTQAVTFTVTYNDNGHGKTKVDFVRVEKRQKTNPPADPESDDGYEFGGWYKESSCENQFIFDTTTIDTNWVLYAKWEKTPFSITYEMNGVGDKGDNPTSYNIETSTITLANPDDVEGYVFEGWYDDADFSHPANKVLQGSAGNKTFYAKWTKKTYRIMYLADNNSQGAVTDQFKEHGLPITLASTGHFNRKGYGAQIGWATVAEGVKVYDFETVYENDAPLTLYPAWGSPIEYTITYVCDVCTGDNPDKPNPHTYTVNDTKGKNLSIYSPTYPNNYEFKGWYWDKAYTKRTTNIPMDTVGNLTLYGKTLKYYYLTYELYGSTKSNNPAKYTIEQTITLKDPAPRAGYTFGGWYTENTFVNKITEIQLGSSEDMTLHAKWIPESVETQYGAITITESNIKVDGEIVTTRAAVIDGNSIESTNIPEDITVNTVVFNRTFTPGTRSTIVLPFDIAVANTHGGTFNILKSISADFKTITLGEKEGELKAYEPYVVLTEGTTLTFDGPITIKQTVSNDQQIVGSDWYFKAALEKIVFGEREDLYGRAYGFAGVSVEGFSAGQFVKAGKKAWVGPMKGYLVYTGELNGSASKSAVGAGLAGELPDEINVVVQDEQGNVVERGVMNTKTGEFRMDRWYDLQGRKLNGQPKVQGTYYHNGKRVIVK